MLQHVIERLSFSQILNQTIVATTTLPEDNAVEELCRKNNYSYCRGSSEDVLSRYFEAAKQFGVKIIIRITADCPLIDPRIIDSMLKQYLSNRVDYLSNITKRTFPRGLDVEIFSFDALAKAHSEANENFEREHVTPFIYRHPERFSISEFVNDKDYSFHRWTVDTEEDFKLVNEIYTALYKLDFIFYFEDVLKLFERRPELLLINQNIKQKSLGE